MAVSSTHSSSDSDPAAAGASRFLRPESLIAVEEGTVRAAFDREPFTVRHRLAGHPGFELVSLLELARRLPQQSIEYNSGDIPVSVDPLRAPGNGLSAEETIRRIRECRSWMVLKNVEQVPEYRELLETCLQEISASAKGGLPQMRNRQGFVFISSPGAVTPYHIDPEHNFLLQIEGTKTVNIFDPLDREVISEGELERFFSGAHRNLEFRQRYGPKAKTFRLEPGDGLHFPVAAPHWVKNGNEVSVAFSITFRSPLSDRREALYRINSKLRKTGLTPVAPGRSRWRDAAKLGCFELLRRGKRLLLAAGGGRRG